MKQENQLEEEKRNYIPPSMDVMIVYMEQGIAATSTATVAPGMTGGNADALSTDWENEDNTIINQGFQL